jgi:hypothetical protein
MQLFVKTLTGRKVPFSVDDSSNTIESMKEMLQEKEGVPVNQLRLIHNGRALDDKKTYEDYKIKSGDTVHMIIILRGGKLIH